MREVMIQMFSADRVNRTIVRGLARQGFHWEAPPPGTTLLFLNLLERVFRKFSWCKKANRLITVYRITNYSISWSHSTAPWEYWGLQLRRMAALPLRRRRERRENRCMQASPSSWLECRTRAAAISPPSALPQLARTSVP